MRAAIALGSNLGDRRENLKRALEHIRSMAMARPPILVSSIYETEPVDCAPDAPLFLNAVVEIDYLEQPMHLLTCLGEIEDSLGRPRIHDRNAPRTIDLDLLYFGNVMLSIVHLQLPHPRMYQRRFVLEPLAEIRPDFVPAGKAQDVATLLRNLPETTPLVRVATEW
ncbi:MAG: 2-amino-4-hydroxy-6-hydroxymethyldihydropteridine diphosphokinase [Chthoniobacterales bacterium]